MTPFITMILISVTAVLVVGAIRPYLNDRRKTKMALKSLDTATKATSNEVVYGCRTGHGTTKFKGFDITDKVVALGATALPSVIKYEFFPKLSILLDGYDYYTNDYENVVMIRWEGRTYTAEVDVYNPNLDNAFLAASEEVFKLFANEAKAILAERQRQERLMNFVKESPKKNSLPVIGETKEWVEDK